MHDAKPPAKARRTTDPRVKRSNQGSGGPQQRFGAQTVEHMRTPLPKMGADEIFRPRNVKRGSQKTAAVCASARATMTIAGRIAVPGGRWAGSYWRLISRRRQNPRKLCDRKGNLVYRDAINRIDGGGRRMEMPVVSKRRASAEQACDHHDRKTCQSAHESAKLHGSKITPPHVQPQARAAAKPRNGQDLDNPT